MIDTFKKFIDDEFDMQCLDHNIDGYSAIVTPMFIIIEKPDRYEISFDFDQDKAICIKIYIAMLDICDNIFPIENCYFEVDSFQNIISIKFSEEARIHYYEFVNNMMNNNNEYLKNVTWQ